jgi:2-polyprenyl-3-methyl-5-hydroxy-6-metoxy-1,4-benzoquinol methylase
MPARTKEAVWYDKFYQTIQTEMASWNQFLLPELSQELNPDKKLLELGCGQGHVIRYLAAKKLIKEENIFAIDQSETAVEFVKHHLPNAKVITADLLEFKFPVESIDICLLMETVEHLTDPGPVLSKIYEALVPNGLLYLSFPNYIHFPWLIVRILAEKLNKPNWISLQPIDKIYTVFGIIKFAKRAGFHFEKGIGTTYSLPLPPHLLKLAEPRFVTRGLNTLRLWWLSFHPILKFRKAGAAGDPSPGTPVAGT